MEATKAAAQMALTKQPRTTTDAMLIRLFLFYKTMYFTGHYDRMQATPKLEDLLSAIQGAMAALGLAPIDCEQAAAEELSDYDTARWAANELGLAPDLKDLGLDHLTMSKLITIPSLAAMAKACKAIQDELNKRTSMEAEEKKQKAVLEELGQAITAAQDALTLLEQATAQKQASLDALDLNVSTAQERTATVELALSVRQQELQSAQQELDAKQESNAALDLVLSTKQQEVESVQHQLEAKQQELGSVQGELSMKQQELESVQQQQETKQVELSMKQQQLDSVQHQLEAKQQELGSVQGELSMKQQEVEAVQVQLEAKQQEMESVQQALDSVQGELVTKQQELESVLLEVTNRQAVVADLDTDVKAKQAAATELDTTITAQQALTTELEARISVKQALVNGLDITLVAKQTLAADLDESNGAKQTQAADLDLSNQTKQALAVDLDAAIIAKQGELQQVNEELNQARLAQEQLEQAGHEAARLLEAINQSQGHIAAQGYNPEMNHDNELLVAADTNELPAGENEASGQEAVMDEGGAANLEPARVLRDVRTSHPTKGRKLLRTEEEEEEEAEEEMSVGTRNLEQEQVAEGTIRAAGTARTSTGRTAAVRSSGRLRGHVEAGTQEAEAVRPEIQATPGRKTRARASVPASPGVSTRSRASGGHVTLDDVEQTPSRRNLKRPPAIAEEEHEADSVQGPASAAKTGRTVGTDRRKRRGVMEDVAE